MKEYLPLLALVPYAIALVWMLRRAPLRAAVLLPSAVATIALVWGLLYLVLVRRYFAPPSPEEAFASVEYIIAEMPRAWRTRYLVENFGVFIGAAFYATCFGLARMRVDATPGGASP